MKWHKTSNRVWRAIGKKALSSYRKRANCFGRNTYRTCRHLRCRPSRN
nr:MAG TPA: hypothetical protein [Caudoviricetes sp.]